MSISVINVSSPSNEILYTSSAMGNTKEGINASSAVVNNVIVDNSLNVAATYVKLWNLASGSVTVGTTDPDEIIYVPAGAIVTHVLYTGAAVGKTFATGLTAAAVTTGGTGGVTSPSSACKVTVSYI